jgi:hypothetical protein
MTDTSLIDLGPFFERYDRRNQRLMVVALCASLMLATAIATHLLATGAPGLKGVRVIWGTGVVFTPLFIAGWWTFGGLMALRRRRAAPLDGSHPAGAVDAGNGMRIANAGFAFNLALMAAMLAGQVVMALVVFGFGHQIRGDLIARAIMLTVGVATIYLGNLWPRMPVSRAPEQKAAATMKANRYAGWFMVAVGLLVFLWGVFVPFSPATQPPFEASKHREITLPQAELDRFVGRYDFGTGFVVSVTHPGATLWVLREGIAGERGAPIYPEARAAFFWKAVEAQLRFTTDANGAVVGAEFREAGPWQPGERIAP